MRTLLFILGGKVDGQTPSRRFAMRLEWAIDYAQRHDEQEVAFLVSGRCANVMNTFTLTEAEVGKRYILERIPNARVIKEDISVETIGNYAFSMPLIRALDPQKTIILTSTVMQERAQFITHKLLGSEFKCEFVFMKDELDGDLALLQREQKALKLIQDILADVPDGDDAKARETILYNTPYYFKGIIDDKMFFDAHWDGGFEDFTTHLAIRHNK